MRLEEDCGRTIMSSPNPERSPPPKRRCRVIVALSTLLGVAAVWFFFLYHHASVAERELRAAMAELDAMDPGWKLEDLEANRDKVPDNETAPC